jgi:hypothetical protein
MQAYHWSGFPLFSCVSSNHNVVTVTLKSLRLNHDYESPRLDSWRFSRITFDCFWSLGHSIASLTLDYNFYGLTHWLVSAQTICELAWRLVSILTPEIFMLLSIKGVSSIYSTVVLFLLSWLLKYIMMMIPHPKPSQSIKHGRHGRSARKWWERMTPTQTQTGC